MSESILPLTRAESPTPSATVNGNTHNACTPNTSGADQGDIQALLVGAREAARLCGVSLATWHRLNAALKVPKPTRLGGRVLWSMDSLRLFVELGCPDRRTFEVRREAAKK
jgi:predicted DNA-binding transcriptional regulator AlpA